MESLVLIVFLVVFIILGAPIGFVMVVLPTVYILITGALPLVTIPYQMYEAIAHAPLIAIPFFLLTGELMNNGGITAPASTVPKMPVMMPPTKTTGIISASSECTKASQSSFQENGTSYRSYFLNVAMM